MPESIKDILISYRQPDFAKKIINLRIKLQQAAWFRPGDGRYRQLQEIIFNVNKQKDKALEFYTEKFDGIKLTADRFRVPEQDLRKAHEQIEPKLLDTLRRSIANVRKYQGEIFVPNLAKIKKHAGIKYTPIKRVGICVPGASAPLPSTVIMTAVPAQVAGVEEISIVSPPRYKGSIHPVILAVCHELNITRVYRVGGAQAVAALAAGTPTIEKVYKIVGPGNPWTQMAKREVFGVVDIDSVAGPSEVLILANQHANPAWVAADMLSQAEHDPGSAVVFTDSRELAINTAEHLKKQLQNLSRKKQTEQCLKEFSKIAIFKTIDDAIEAANNLASEHLQIQCGPDTHTIADKIENAGAVFLGEYTPVAVGDYWAGPSHTLPTGMTAWFFSPLSSNDFVKSTSIIRYDKNTLRKSADHIIRLAETEGLDAHAESVRIRNKK